MNLRTFRIVLWSAVVVVAIAAAGLYMFVKPTTGGFGGGQYTLETGAGQPFTAASLTGGPSMLFFGYTHCPDVCPTTLSEMAAWYGQLGEAGKPLRAFFVTVDPERDTPAVINDYVHAVSDRVTGVTGTPSEIGKMETVWGVYAKKVPMADGDYSMDHTATVYLIDSRGQFQGTIAYDEDSATALQKLKNLIAKG
ncbi:MAG: SCO family protein [Devosia sp.]